MSIDETGQPRLDAVRLTWSGKDTSAYAIEALQRQARVEIALPASIHHALFSRLNPNAGTAAMEAVDASGGVELIATLATITGLDAMAELAEPLTRWGYRVHLISPGPVLSLIPPQMA